MKTRETNHSGLSPEKIKELSYSNRKIVSKNKQIALHDDLLKIKKDRRDKDLAIRPLLLNIGMVLSLSLVIVAINWKSYSEASIVDLGKVEAEVNEIIDIPLSEQKPPPPPKQQVFKIQEVKDTEVIEEIALDLDVEVTEEEAVAEVEVIMIEEEEEVVEEIFVIVEQEPTPIGGFEEFYTYLAQQIKYPPAALRLGIEGSVFVQFVIEKDGKITNVELAKGIGAGCDEEALRVISSSPDWNPGKQRGLPVRVRKIIPVRFIMAKQ